MYVLENKYKVKLKSAFCIIILCISNLDNKTIHVLESDERYECFVTLIYVVEYIFY